MDCQACKRDTGPYVLMIPTRLPNRKVIFAPACLDCAEKSPIYCFRHKLAHHTCPDSTSFCILCASESFEANRHRAKELYERILDDLSADEFELLTEAAEESSGTGYPHEESVLLFVVSMSCRRKMTPDAVVSMLLQEDSASLILYGQGT